MWTPMRLGSGIRRTRHMECNMTQDDTENESTEEQEEEAPAHIGPLAGAISLRRGEFAIPACGQLVRAGDAEGVALFVRDLTAEERTIAATGKTVAEHNPGEPPESPVVGVVHKGQLRDRFDDRWEQWRRTEPEYLTFSCGNAGVAVYDYPATALEWGADTGSWRCKECGTPYIELELSGDARRDFGPCPECGEMALSKALPEPEAAEEASE